MVKVNKRAALQQPKRIEHVRRGLGRIELRRFDPARDSFDALTTMLHRAFARLGAMGLNCTCVDQSAAVTRSRATRGDCYVAVYRHGEVASMRQFGVEPAWQARGIGTLLLAFADHWAATRGYAELALDTPQPAAHLIAFYRGHGFRIVDFMRFDGKRYDSAILSKPAVAARTLATWSQRLELPRRQIARAA
jgi:GNAT superfamily N-acetyltransferase